MLLLYVSKNCSLWDEFYDLNKLDTFEKVVPKFDQLSLVPKGTKVAVCMWARARMGWKSFEKYVSAAPLGQERFGRVA